MSPELVAVCQRAVGRRNRILIGLVLALLFPALATASVGDAGPAARAARTISLNDSAHLHLTSHHGFVLNEQGTASGTIRGTIYLHLNVSSTNHVTAVVNIYPSGGSITGNASASYRVHGATATFSGTLNITRGSGSYNHAHGTGLSFTGTIQRSNDATTVQVNGRLST